MSAKHTPGRLTQGYTLATPQTRQWSGQQWEQNEAREKCLVFADFTSADLGRSRKLVAQCHQGPEDARRLAACWNACDGVSTEHLEDDAVRKLIQDRDLLLAQRYELLEFAQSVVRYAGSAGDDYIADKARSAIAKVIG